MHAAPLARDQRRLRVALALSTELLLLLGFVNEAGAADAAYRGSALVRAQRVVQRQFVRDVEGVGFVLRH